MVDDVTVGSVSGIDAMQRPDGSFFAAVKLALDRNVVLPANSTARVAQTSLLGSQHVELAAPSNQPPVGRLVDGSTIQESRTSRYPTTEEVLSALGVVVNKGNLAALQEITDETYKAVAGRESQFVNLVPRLAELTAGLNRQVNDIVACHRRFGPVLGDPGEQQGQPGADTGFAAGGAAGAQQEPGQDRRGVRRTQEGGDGCVARAFANQGGLCRRPQEPVLGDQGAGRQQQELRHVTADIADVPVPELRHQAGGAR